MSDEARVKKNLCVSSAIFGLLFSCSSLCADGNVKEYDGIVVNVNDQIITKQDWEQRVKMTMFSMGGNFSPEMRKKIKTEVLSEMIADHLKKSILKKFEPATGWIPEGAVDEAIKDIAARNNMSVDGFRNLLKNNGVKFDSFKEQIKVNLSWMEYIKARYGKSVNISDFEVRSLVKDMHDKMNRSAYYVSKMFFPVSDSKEERQVAAKVNNIQQMLRSGANFANVARQFSSSTDAVSHGGDIGWVFDGQLPQEEDDALKNMVIGEFKVVKNNRGYSILLLKDKREKGQGSYTDLRFVQIIIPFENANPDQETVSKLLEYAKTIKSNASSSSELIKTAKESGMCVVSDSTSVVLENVPPEMRKLIQGIPAGGIGNPIVTPNGIIMICMQSRKQHAIKEPTPNELKAQKIGEKLSACSEKELRDSKLKAHIRYYGEASILGH